MQLNSVKKLFRIFWHERIALLYKHSEDVASMVLSILKARELKKLSLQELQLLELLVEYTADTVVFSTTSISQQCKCLPGFLLPRNEQYNNTVYSYTVSIVFLHFCAEQFRLHSLKK